MRHASATASPPYGDAHGQCLASVPARKGLPHESAQQPAMAKRTGWHGRTTEAPLMCVPLAPHVVSHAPVQLSSLRWARSMVAERGVRRGVAGRGSRQLSALLTGPRRVFKASRGRGVRGVLEKLKGYKGQRPGRHGQLRACSISNSARTTAMLSPHCKGGRGPQGHVMVVVWCW